MKAVKAFHRRNRGSRQRERKNRNTAAVGSPAFHDHWSTCSTLAPQPVVGLSADIVVTEDNDWGDAVVDLQLEDKEDFTVPTEADGERPETPPCKQCDTFCALTMTVFANNMMNCFL